MDQLNAEEPDSAREVKAGGSQLLPSFAETVECHQWNAAFR
jgi:hypothetical protein